MTTQSDPLCSLQCRDYSLKYRPASLRNVGLGNS